MRIAINAISAQMGGAVTYLRSVVPALQRAMISSSGGSIVVWASAEALGEPSLEGVERRDPEVGTQQATGLLHRLWFDQWQLPRRLRDEGADALFSSANFGTLRSPVRQVLLVRNSLYFDPITLRRIQSRAVRARYAAQRLLTVRSIRAADAVLFPTRAMLELAARYTDGPGPHWSVAPYGVRHDLFNGRDKVPLGARPVVLLNVSLYCDQKNLGTLFRAVQRLHARSPGKHKLQITAGVRLVKSDPSIPNYEAERDSFLSLEREGVVEDLAHQHHVSLPDLYRRADVFVFPSYTESFGHPLVEAMASGLPIVAADVPVNREMCGDAAVYFSPFNVDDCANSITRVVDDVNLAARLRASGLARARDFTWENHASLLFEALRGAPT